MGARSGGAAHDLDCGVLFRATPGSLLVLRPEAPFTIVEANDDYLRATKLDRSQVVGRGVFDLVPAARVQALRSSLERAVRERTTDTLPLNGEGRCWTVTNTPVLDERGAVVFIMHRAEDVTDRVRVEQRATGILESITDAFLSVDREFRLTYANREGRCFLGAIDDNFVGRSLWDLMPALRGSNFERECRAAVDGRRAAHFETPPFSERSFEVHAYPSPDGLSVHFHDVTARKRADARLRILESVVTNANDAVVITESNPLDEPGPEIVYVNEGFTRMTGYRSDEVIGHSPRFMQGPLTSREAMRQMREALDRREPVRAELLNYRKDGTPFWVELMITPVLDEDGQTVHFTAVQRDTTARKKAEEDAIALAREQTAREQAELTRARVTAILESIRDAFFAVDREFRFTYVNRRAEHLFGRNHDELLGRVIWDAFPTLLENKFGLEFKLALDEGRDRSFEEHVATVDRWLEVHLFPSETGVSAYLHDVTERRRIEKSLRESERRYRALFDNSMDAVLLTAPDGTIAMANVAATAMLGYTEEELRELGQHALLDRGDPRVADAIKERRRTGRFRGELRMIRRDGTRFPVEVSSAVYRHGRTGEWTSLFVRDVTHRHTEEAEREALMAELEAERRWLRSVIETVPMGLLLHSADGRLDFNFHAVELFGIGVSSIRGTPRAAHRVLYPDGSPVPPDQTVSARALRTGESIKGAEFLIERRDGVRVPILGSAAPIRDREGRIVGAVSVFQDVTDRVHTAEAIRTSERVLAGIFEILPVGLWVTDQHGRIVRENAAGARIRGGLYPDARKSGEWGLSGALRGETRVGEIIRVETPDGSTKKVRHSALPLHDEQGRFVAAILVDEDITSLKEAMAALRRAVQARDDVLAIVAHDLRNPLTGIVMHSQRLERTVDEPRTREAISAIRTNAQRMNRLIEDLLDVTRIEQGALAIDPTIIRADALLSDVVETERAVAAKNSIQVALDLRGAPVEVWADQERLVQVLGNLIGNAIKFTQQNGRIVVGAAPRGGECVFWVADTGPGVSAEALPHLFDRFWQADRGDRRGAGLGLAITKGIVEQHGGRVWAESTPGNGTTMFFTIPLAENAEAFAHSVSQPH